MFQTQLQQVQFLDKYSRWVPELKRRETWDETVDRVMAFFFDHITSFKDSAHKEIPWKELEEGMLKLEALPSMRTVQMAGPALAREHLCAYNCAALPLKDWRAFSELLYILMQGTGCGFSVEDRFISQLPVIQAPSSTTATVTYIIEDTTEGWCNALLAALEETAHGHTIEFNYSLIRPQGTPLSTKGGRASGPEPLRQLLNTVVAKVRSRAGRRLSSLDCHDIACLCGSIVQVGGVRRAAEISLSDLDDTDLRDAKRGAFWETAPHRAMANNSAVYEDKPDAKTFLHEWLSLIESGTGERGIFNRGGLNQQIPARRLKRDDWLVNPCGEIILRPFGLCNLSIAVARAEDTFESLSRKVRLAAIWGTLQSTLTNFSYVREDWRTNAEEERLLGVDINGQMDAPHLFEWATDLVRYKNTVIETNAQFANLLGISPSVATTCVKPSGNSSQLLDCSSGLHPRYASYYIRRLRIGAHTPMGAWLRHQGVPWHPEVGQSVDEMTVMVVEFPVKAPEGAKTRHDFTAVQMLNYWRDLKKFYTEHNPSITCYVEDHEWPRVGAWVYENWDLVGGLTFLPKDGGQFILMPYEEISQSEYEKRVATFPALDFTALQKFETEDTTTINQEYSCLGGQCDI